MKPNIILTLGIVVVLAGGAFYVSNLRQASSETGTPKDIVGNPTIVMTPGDETEKETSRYVVYSKSAFDAAKGKKRVYFFHAPWCPTCRPADAQFQANVDSIPEDVILFKTDYDSSTDLKKQYNVTYQHTFVLVDDTGREVTKWNGGSINELVANTR